MQPSDQLSMTCQQKVPPSEMGGAGSGTMMVLTRKSSLSTVIASESLTAPGLLTGSAVTVPAPPPRQRIWAAVTRPAPSTDTSPAELQLMPPAMALEQSSSGATLYWQVAPSWTVAPSSRLVGRGWMMMAVT